MLDMFAQNFLQDSSFPVMHSSTCYQWFFDAERQLLLVLPEFNSENSVAKSLWLKILKSCRLTDWLDAFSDTSKNKIIFNKMIFTDLGINLLIEHYTPKYLWIIGEHKLRENLNIKNDIHMIFTEEYSKWASQSLIKKQIWLNWLSIH